MHAHCHYLKLINVPCKADDENLFAPASLFNYPDISIAIMIEHANSATQIGKTLSFGNNLFKNHGFRAPVSYKAGGWCAGKKTYQALLRSGFNTIAHRCLPNTSSNTNSLLVFPGNLGMVDYVDNAIFDSVWGSLWTYGTTTQSPLVVNTGWHPGSFRFWQSRAEHLSRYSRENFLRKTKGR